MNADAIKARFATELRRCLKEHYGAVPSCEVLARDFSLHTNSPVTREASRKWVRGQAFPDLSRLGDLIVWLHLDMRAVFCASADTDSVYSKLEADPKMREIEGFLKTVPIDLLQHIQRLYVHP